jgi:hypothetical protein
VRLLKPNLAVSPIEEMDMSDAGKKRVQRAVKHSIATLNDIKSDSSLSDTIWLAPVVIEEPKMLA